jgi:hypothetical protein
MTHDPFVSGYLSASDRAADDLISRDDDPDAEAEHWCLPRTSPFSSHSRWCFFVSSSDSSPAASRTVVSACPVRGWVSRIGCGAVVIDSRSS